MRPKKLIVAATAAVLVSATGVAAASYSGVKITGSGGGAASLSCPGGMTRLGHPFDEMMSIFPDDPAIQIHAQYTVAENGYLVEDIDTGAHAGTHLDAPAHFIEGARSVDQLAADEFVWPAYKIDVRGVDFPDGLVGQADIEAYEHEHGKITPGSLVILQTGAEEFFGLDGPGDVRHSVDGNAANTDDLFDFDNAGFSGAAVQWLFDARDIAGVGADAYGPDAAADDTYDATYTTLANDGVALVALANLDSVSVRGDVIMAPAVALTDGSGFSTDPIACHAKQKHAKQKKDESAKK